MDQSAPKLCEQCHFWSPDSGATERLKERDLKGATGICHRYPPTHPSVSTSAAWWCGEWLTRQVAKEIRAPFLKRPGIYSHS